MTRTRRLACGALLLLGGCAAQPLGYLQGDGPASRPLVALGWGFVAIACGVSLIIAILVLAATFRRRPAAMEGSLAVSRTGGGMRWITVGLLISVPVLLGMSIWTVASIRAVAAPPTRPALTIEITAARWWWGAIYRSTDDARSFETADEFVIPVGVPVRFVLKSRDVIHSFWVPKLAGKMDTIPGKANITWLQADHPGVYRGQCTEYCGYQHANMAFQVIAVPPAQFRQWWDWQLAGRLRRPLPTPVAAAGAALFMRHCAACHAVRGTEAGGIVGPDLSAFGGRHTIAAGTLPNTPQNLAYWINHTQRVKPGAEMPEFDLPPVETAAITTWLEAQ